MIRNIKTLAAYLELESFSDEALTEYLSNKIPGAWVKSSSQEKIPKGSKLVLAEARGTTMATGIKWNLVKIEGRIQSKESIPTEVVQCLEAEWKEDGTLCSELTFLPVMMKFLHDPIDKIKVRVAPEGYIIQFKVKVPIYRDPRMYLLLGVGEDQISITFPFTEDEWDKAEKEVRFL